MEQNLEVDISDRHSNHVVRVIRDLWEVGWIPSLFPDNAQILPNRQLLELRTPHRSIRIRVSVYKVGDRGEPHRLDERRIEITTTFASGLPRLRNWADVVLGYDLANDAYVGLDPRRLGLGGTTHNASSSVDPEALRMASKSRIIIRPHETASLGLEYQAIFRPARLSEYLFNYGLIHSGLYVGDGLFSGTTQLRKRHVAFALPQSCCRGKQLVLTNGRQAVTKGSTVSPRLVEAYEREESESLRDLSPDELEAIRRKCREVGDRGEHLVYRHERQRLHRAGRADLADKVVWVSQRSVSKGYDIKSFEIDGSPRLIEVKSTIGRSRSFFVSSNEWKVATRRRNSYWIYRVIDALESPTIAVKLQDPVGAEEANAITRMADGWWITVL
jgi:hypothetical protein